MKKLGYFIIFILLSSCTNDTKFIDNLTDINKKWLYIKPGVQIDSLNNYIFITYLIFDENETWNSFYIKSHLSSKSTLDKWTYNSKGKLLILGNAKELMLNITRFSKDTIYFEDFNKKKGALLNIQGKNIEESHSAKQ